MQCGQKGSRRRSESAASRQRLRKEVLETTSAQLLEGAMEKGKVLFGLERRVLGSRRVRFAGAGGGMMGCMDCVRLLEVRSRVR